MTQTRKWLFLGLGLLTLTFFYYASVVLMPFFIATLLAYLTDPLVELLVKLKIPRVFGVIMVFLLLIWLFILLVLVLIPLIQEQIVLLIGIFPRFIAWLQGKVIPWINETFYLHIKLNLSTITHSFSENWRNAGDLATQVLRTVTHSGVAIIAFFTNLVLIPVVLFYLLRDWDKLINGTKKLIPRQYVVTTVNVVTECDEVLSAFLRGQLMVMIGLGVLYSIGLSIIGVNLALLIGMISGIVSIVPYLGFIVGIVAASVAALFQFQDITHIIYVVIVFALAQSIESMVMTPLFVGDKIGLHPVAVIFAILAGGAIFGFLGILLALPVAAVMMVFIRHLRQYYFNSHLYNTPQEDL